MSVVPMKKIRLYVHRSCLDEALSIIQNLASVEFEQVHNDQATDSYATAAVSVYTRLDQAIRF